MIFLRVTDESDDFLSESNKEDRVRPLLLALDFLSDFLLPERKEILQATQFMIMGSTVRVNIALSNIQYAVFSKLDNTMYLKIWT